MSRHQGRGGRPAHASIVQLLGPAMFSKSASNGTLGERTVNGRTLIATLIEEAPSVAAIIACASYAPVEFRAVVTRSLGIVAR